jgi:hypothetical protein
LSKIRTMKTKDLTMDEGLKNMQKMHFQMLLVEKLGGRDSFFGMKEIFEITLKEEHEKDPENPKTGMYRYKGLWQYGNIVLPNCVKSAVKRCVEELKFTKEEFDKLLDWYDRKDSPDVIVVYFYMKYAIEDFKYFQDDNGTGFTDEEYIAGINDGEELEFPFVTDHVTDHATDHATDQVNELIKILVIVLSGEMSRQEY